jgi:hypothetical protein
VPLTDAGTVDPEAEAAMTFVPVPCSAGDILFFSGNCTRSLSDYILVLTILFPSS